MRTLTLMGPTLQSSSTGLLIKVDDMVCRIVRSDMGRCGSLGLGIGDLGVFRVPGEPASFIQHIKVHLRTLVTVPH